MSQQVNVSSPKLQQSQNRPRWMAFLMIVGGIALMAFAIGGLLGGLPSNSSAGQAAGGPVRAGTKLADFALQDLSGKTVRLSDYAGRPVLVNTWATWCPPCRAEMPSLQAYYEKHKGEGFVVLAVNVGESKELARGFVDEQKLTFPILLDTDERFADSLRIHDFPTSIIIGKDGKVSTVHIGMYSPEQLEYDMAQVMK